MNPNSREFAEKVVEELCELDATDSDIMEDDAGLYYVYLYYPDRSIANYISIAVPLITNRYGDTPAQVAKYLLRKANDYAALHNLEHTI